MPPHAMALYFRLCALIRARKWKAAAETADELDAAMKGVQ